MIFRIVSPDCDRERNDHGRSTTGLECSLSGILICIDQRHRSLAFLCSRTLLRFITNFKYMYFISLKMHSKIFDTLAINDAELD